MNYLSKSYRLGEDVVEALEALEAEYGSVNKGLRAKLLEEQVEIVPDVDDRLPGKTMAARAIRPLRVKGDGKR